MSRAKDIAKGILAESTRDIPPELHQAHKKELARRGLETSHYGYSKGWDSRHKSAISSKLKDGGMMWTLHDHESGKTEHTGYDGTGKPFGDRKMTVYKDDSITTYHPKK